MRKRAEQAPQSETQIQTAMRLAVGLDPDVLLYRNSVGVIKHGNRTVRYGLGKGSSDLVGVLTVSGRGIALFVEVKTETGRLTKEQEQFRRLVIRRGAVHIVARSVDELLAGIAEAKVRYA